MKRSIEYIICKHCGKTWGNHFAENCFHTGTLFEPKGYYLSDICGHCGKRLDEHKNHLDCPTLNNERRKKFRKKIFKFDDDDLFEI